MSRQLSVTLFEEDWSALPLGNLKRDNTARGEYMAQVVPPNVNGWYHNARVGTSRDDVSPFRVKRSGKGRVIEQPAETGAQAAVLTTGEKPWRDFAFEASVTVGGTRAAGLVARYRTNRDFYALAFESGTVKLVRVVENVWTVLDSKRFAPSKKPVRARLAVEADGISARVGDVELAARDGSIASGGIGLLANGPAVFGPLRVTATRAEANRVAREGERSAAAVVKKRAKLPAMRLAAELDVTGHAVGRQLRFADLDGDGRKELVFAAPSFVHTQGARRPWRYNVICRLSALDLEGRVLWERGELADDTCPITADLPFQAGDRGEGMEVVACFGPRIEILDPMTGRTRRSAPTPEPAPLPPGVPEEYLSWGEGSQAELDRVLPDAVYLCNATGRAPHGDLYVKDRYRNAWVLDGGTLEVLWHCESVVGHFPCAADIDGDGRDEFIMGYHRYDGEGNLIGRLKLGDHPDGCFTYVDERGVRHFMHPCGEAGYVDQGARLDEVHLGHVQHLSVANFVPDLPDLERVVVTYHGNEGIIVLLDCENRVIRKTERYASGSVCQPVNSTGDGRELVAFSPRRGDGGLWDAEFDLVVPFPTDDRPAKYMEVGDVIGLGADQVIVWDESRLHVYAPDRLPEGKPKLYAPVRPGPNMSNYQVNYSLPAWRKAT